MTRDRPGSPERQDVPTKERTDWDPLGLIAGGEGVITGTVVCAAVIAYGAGHASSTTRLTLAILVTVLVYWLAHLHAVTIGESVKHGHHPLRALRQALTETWPIAAVSALPILILVVAEAFGAALATAAWIALLATIGLLTLYSYLAGARGGLSLWGRIGSAVVGAAIGILVAALKVGLH